MDFIRGNNKIFYRNDDQHPYEPILLSNLIVRYMLNSPRFKNIWNLFLHADHPAHEEICVLIFKKNDSPLYFVLFLKENDHNLIGYIFQAKENKQRRLDVVNAELQAIEEAVGMYSYSGEKTYLTEFLSEILENGTTADGLGIFEESGLFQRTVTILGEL